MKDENIEKVDFLEGAPELYTRKFLNNFNEHAINIIFHKWQLKLNKNNFRNYERTVIKVSVDGTELKAQGTCLKSFQ